MKKISDGLYEHTENNLKFKCEKGDDIYNIKVWDQQFNRYVKCGTGTSLDSCTRMIKRYVQM